MDEDKKNFKLLTNFLNSYKNKLMIGNTIIKKDFDKTKAKVFTHQSKHEQALPLTTAQLHEKKQEGDRDITLDYDIYQKLQGFENSKEGKF